MPPEMAAAARKDKELQPNDPLFGGQWALDVVRATEAWDIHTGSPDIVIAVIEPGIGVNHPDLEDQLLKGWDVWDDDESLEDSSKPRKFKDSTDHGTHMCGIIAARSNNGLGISGLAPDCKILPVRSLTYDDENLAKAIRFAVDAGASVINLSDGGYMHNVKHSLPVRFSAWNPPPSDELISACEYAYESEVFIATSTGGNQAHNVAKYAGLCPGVMVVASADRSGRMSDFNDYGDTIQVAAPAGWRAFDLQAEPGRRILPLTSQDVIDQAVGDREQDEYGVLSAITPEHGGFTEWSGGCMAIAHVSALAGLIRSKHPSLGVDEIKAIIRNTANQPAGDGTGWNPYVGHGTIDAFEAIRVDRVEPEVEIDSVGIVELDRGMGTASVKVVNRGVLDATDVAVSLFDAEPDEGGGRQLAFALVSVVPGREHAEIELPFWIPDGMETLVAVCDPRGQLSTRQRNEMAYYTTESVRLTVAV